MKPIILIDHEDNSLYIAEIRKPEDLQKIDRENKKLNEEQRDDNRERTDYYEELSNRT
jgi:hypothetical protein